MPSIDIRIDNISVAEYSSAILDIYDIDVGSYLEVPSEASSLCSRLGPRESRKN